MSEKDLTYPVSADQFGKAPFDTVGPLLLTGWKVGPGQLQRISSVGTPSNTEGQTAVVLTGDGGAMSTALCTVANNISGQQISGQHARQLKQRGRGVPCPHR